jgi:predicted CXXCH cytochrome family protein
VAFPLFEDPPAGAANFLGYSNQEANLPVCGNCHVGQNSEWQQTAHASAWEGLQSSSHAAESCEGCHTVSENGNAAEDANAGWVGTKDPRYQNVQCESCHGPGLAHVTNPDAGQPLASILVGTDLTNGCGECHTGSHHGFVDEWIESRHGEGAHRPQYREREECRTCHGARGAFEAWGVDARYLEKEGTDGIGIVCAVCHDPHDATNEHQLRFPITSRDVNVNLCMKCHQRRAIPDVTSEHGPHSPQGPLLLGEDVGWQPPNFAYTNTAIRGTHGSEANTELCATCHLNAYTVTDQLTGAFVWSVKGHSFQPIPCLDESGIPDPQATCTTAERSFASCTASGCHGSQDAARSAYIVATTRIAELVEELEALLDMVPATEFDTEDGVYTTAEGSLFNAELGAITSSAIHNPFLTEALLTASIKQVETDYGLGALSTISLENMFDPQ